MKLFNCSRYILHHNYADFSRFRQAEMSQSKLKERLSIGPLQEPVTWYGINYALRKLHVHSGTFKSKESWVGL